MSAKTTSTTRRHRSHKSATPASTADVTEAPISATGTGDMASSSETGTAMDMTTGSGDASDSASATLATSSASTSTPSITTTSVTTTTTTTSSPGAYDSAGCTIPPHNMTAYVHTEQGPSSSVNTLNGTYTAVFTLALQSFQRTAFGGYPAASTTFDGDIELTDALSSCFSVCATTQDTSSTKWLPNVWRNNDTETWSCQVQDDRQFPSDFSSFPNHSEQPNVLCSYAYQETEIET
ncbi:hypothetical protein ANO11243_061650 [Dothideomycetidae sp. 11243]|nr:hypothetical protein ANO11243_061650 [fungal sp. No.11243]